MTLTQISTAGVKDDAVTSGKIPANAVGTSEIADQAVTLDKLPHGTSSNNGKFLRANNGADPTFETITGTTINSNANNRVITGSDSANNLNGEANLFFDGSQLGVGTTSPYQYSIAHFESTNGIVLAGSSQSRLLFRHTGGGTDLKMTDIQSSNGKMKFRSLADNTTATTRMVIDDAGKIGIGTPSPDTRLDVARLGSAWTGQDPVAGTVAHLHNGNNGSSSPAYLGLGGGTASLSGINFGDADDADVGRILYSHSDNSLRFNTAAAERMRISSDGDVGIGTTSPNRLLFLSKSSTASYNSTGEGGSDNHILRIHNPNGTDNSGVNNHTGLEFVVSSGANSHGYLGLVRTGNNTGDFFYKTRTGGNSYAERLRIQNGGGISFNGDTAAANALDDYEEGSWSPTIEGTTTTGTVTYQARNGKYVKIGKVVNWEFYVSWNNGNGGGNLHITGLPFTTAANGTYPAVTIGYVHNYTLRSDHWLTGLHSNNSNYLYFYERPNGGGSNLQLDYDGSGSMIMSGHYEVN